MNNKYNFDLKSLEDAAIKALDDYYKQDTEDTRTNLLFKIKDLTFAILCVGDFSKHNIDVEETSYDYALYLFERIVLGTFNPYKSPKFKDRFPFQNYISKNIYHIILTKKEDNDWFELLDDLEFIINKNNTYYDLEQPEQADVSMDKYFLAKNLYKILRMFYTNDEIRRLLPFSYELINVNKYNSDSTPSDVKEFSMILISAAKRLVSDYNVVHTKSNTPSGIFRKVLSSSVRSTIFLSAIVNSKIIPKELLLSLDIDSLYRLVYLVGGKTIKIPTKNELDTLIGSVVSVSKIILEGKDITKSLLESKNDYDLLFAKQINIKNFISNLIECYNIFGEDKATEPLINILISSLRTMNSLLKDVSETKIENPEMLLGYYKEISETFKSLSDGLLKISEKTNTEVSNNAQ